MSNCALQTTYFTALIKQLTKWLKGGKCYFDLQIEDRTRHDEEVMDWMILAHKTEKN